MPIDPNLLIQLIITLTNLMFEMQRRRVDLSDKTRDELLDILRRLNEEMKNQPDLKQ